MCIRCGSVSCYLVVLLAMAAACNTFATREKADYPRCFRLAADSSNPQLRHIGPLPHYLELDTLQIVRFKDDGSAPAYIAGWRRDSYWRRFQDSVEVSVATGKMSRQVFRFPARNERRLSGRVSFTADIVGVDPTVAILATRTRCTKP
jgi:hypothetical protein